MTFLALQVGVDPIAAILLLPFVASRICKGLADYWNAQIARWNAKLAKLEFAINSSGATNGRFARTQDSPAGRTTVVRPVLLESPFMSSPESFIDTATEDEIERAASFFVEMLRKPLVKMGTAPQDLDKVLGLMKRALQEPENLKTEVIRAAKTITPDRLRADLALARDFMRSPRKHVIELIGQSLPAGTPGKAPQVTPEVERRM